jgi:hypothetical protein
MATLGNFDPVAATPHRRRRKQQWPPGRPIPNMPIPMMPGRAMPMQATPMPMQAPTQRKRP